MSKGFFTILLVIIIAYSLSFIPLNSDLINFDFIDNFINADDSEDEPTEEPIEYDYEFYLEGTQTDFENPKLVTIIIETNDIEYILNEGLLFNLYKDDVLYNSFTKDNLIIDIYDSNTVTKIQKKITIDVSLDNLEIEPGNYQMQILSGDPNLIDAEIMLSIEYLDEYDYVGSVDTVPSGKQYLQLYFADNEYNYLIPVNRLINTTEKRIRETINNQYEGPTDASGLSNGNIGPWSYKGDLHGDILDLYYHSADVKPFGIGSTAATLAVDSIVNSMTSIPYVGSVQFYIDNKIPNVEYFHGMVLDEPISPLTWPNLYYGLRSSTDKVYLKQVQVRNLDYKDVFNALQGQSDTLEKYYINTNKTITTIPNTISLLNIELEGKTLTIDLSENVKTIYGDMDNNYKLMIDSILYSYTSFENIENVQILFDGEKLNDFYGYNFSTAIKANAYINLEPK